jgi:hypothetical protein
LIQYVVNRPLDVLFRYVTFQDTLVIKVIFILAGFLILRGTEAASRDPWSIHVSQPTSTTSVVHPNQFWNSKRRTLVPLKGEQTNHFVCRMHHMYDVSVIQKCGCFGRRSDPVSTVINRWWLIVRKHREIYVIFGTTRVIKLTQSEDFQSFPYTATVICQ